MVALKVKVSEVPVVEPDATVVPFILNEIATVFPEFAFPLTLTDTLACVSVMLAVDGLVIEIAMLYYLHYDALNQMSPSTPTGVADCT